MGIYRGGYRTYDGPKLPPETRFLVIAALEFRRFFRQRWVKWLALACCVPVVLFSAIVLVKVLVENMAQGAIPSLDLLPKLLASQLQLMALLAAVAGAGLIAEDRAGNALLLYLARPLSPERYAAGKLLALGGLLGLAYILPALLYVLLELLVGPSLGALGVILRILATVGTTALHVLVTTLLVLALSSLGTRARYVGLAWVGIFYLSEIMAVTAKQALDVQWVELLSLVGLYKKAAELLIEGNSDGALAFVILAFLGIGAALFLRMRVRRLADAAEGQ